MLTRGPRISVRACIVAVLGLSLVSFPALAQTFQDAGFASDLVTTLPAFKPVGITWAPDGRMFVWQRDGVVRVFKNGALLPTPFIDISSQVNTYVDRGALGLALHPDFASNGYVYVLFTREEGGNPNDSGPKVSRLIRVTADPSNPDVALPGSELILLGTVGTPPCGSHPTGSDCIPSDSNTHSIGTLRFSRDGKLLVGNGDGADASGVDGRALRAQDLNAYSGKILRVNDDGTAPGDNPWDDGTNSIRSKVWAYGLRNPYRFAIDPDRNELLLGDVGWNTWEEIDRIQSGKNYGWPCYEGFLPQPLYSAQLGDCGLLPSGSVAPPVVSWAHDDASPTLPGFDATFLGDAAIGGTVYTGAAYPEQYDGSFFYGDYVAGWIRRLVFDSVGGFQNIPFANDIDGLVSLEQGPDGNLYYVSFPTGQIRRIRFNGPVAKAAATPSSGYSPLDVTFRGDQSLNPVGGNLTYLWEFGDGQSATTANPVHTFISAAPVRFDARLTVTDANGASSVAAIPVTVGSLPPAPTIVSPADGTGVLPGQTVSFRGTATDPDETLGPSALHWTALLHHNDHIHTMLDVGGSTGTLVAQYHGPIGTYAYELRLTATDSIGLTGTVSIQLPVLSDTTPPTAPANLAAATRGRGQVDLTWTAASDNAAVAGYRVDRCTGAGCSSFAEIAIPGGSKTSFSDTTVSGNIAYRYRVRAVDGTGNLSGYSNTVDVTTPVGNGIVAAYAFDDGSGSSAADSSPFGNTASVSGATWQPAGKNGGALEFGATSHLAYVAASPSLDTPIAITIEAWVYPTASQSGWRAIVQRETDAYFLHAGSSGGALRPTVGGIFSGQLDYLLAPAAIPVGTWTHLAYTWDGATIRLFVNGIEVASKARAGTLQTAVAGAGPVRIGNNVPYVENFLGRVDDVRIYDVALTPAQIASDMATAVPSGPDTTAPSAPGSLVATATGSSQITLAWSASTDSGGSGVSGYRVERCQGAGCAGFVEIAPAATTAFVDTGLSSATLYRYRVRAVDGAGNHGTYSNEAEATTLTVDTTAPSAPGAATVLAVGPGQLQVSWGAAVDNAGGTGVASYEVERCLGAGCANFSQIANVTTTVLLDSGLADGTIYTYRIRAVDGAGNRGPYTSPAQGTTPAPDLSPPSTPGNPVATPINAATIRLTWTASTDAGGSGLAGYRVERCQGSGCSSFAEIAQPTGTSYDDTGRTASTTYGYRVRAIDGAGNLGSYSTVAVGTTPAATGLVAAYAFSEGSGASTADASGNANTGTITGATWNTTGKYGNSLTFDGTSDVVRIPNSTSLNLTTGMTLEAWVYPTQAQTGWRAVVQREPDAYLLHAGSFLGALQPTAGGTFGTALDYFATAGAIPTGTWTHLALTWDGATMRIYVNGIQQASKARTGTLQGTSGGAGAVRIGNNSPYGERFIGRIDEVRIYNRGLSAAEVVADMSTAIGFDTTPPTVPGSLRATAQSASQIALTWTASTDTGGSGLAGYRVERCQGSACSSFVEVAQPASNGFVDTGLSASTLYRYRVRAIDGAGNLGGYSNIAEATTQGGTSDTTPPTAPDRVIASRGSATRIDLSWKASTDAGGSGLAGYTIERCRGAGCTDFVSIGQTATTSFSDASLPTTGGPPAIPGTELGRVAASMAPGTWAEVSTLNMVPTLFADGIGGSILDYAEDGAWDPVTQQFLFIGCDHPYDSNGDLARFVAYSAVTNSWRVMPYPSWFPDSIMHGYDHNGIDPGRGYFYHRMYSQPVVQRYDIQAGTWSTLPTIPASVLPYATCCMGLEYSPEMDGLVLAATTHESTLDEAIFYSESDGQWSTVADGRPMGTHNHFVEHNPVHKSVLFGGGSGSGALYTLFADGTVADHTPAPFNLGILESVVTVDPVGGNYLVLGAAGEFYAFDPVGDRWSSLPGTVPVFSPVRGTSLVWQTLATPIPDYGVVMFVKFYFEEPQSRAWVYLYKHSPSTVFRYRVRAVDGAGNVGPLSNEAQLATAATTDTIAPTAPTSLGATATSSSQISLAWTASTDAGGSGLAGYRVERCQGSGCSTFVEIAQPITSSFVDSGLAASTLYRYRVRAADVSGNLSGYSNTGQATTQASLDVTPPTAPSSLAASSTSATGVSLTWVASTDAGGSGLAGYRVERCQGSGCSTFVEIAQPATNAFVDGGLTASSVYRYRVRAADLAGNLSGYSNELTVATGSTSGPIAAYGFDEGSGSTAFDSSLRGNTATVSGALWQPAGKNGGALEFSDPSHVAVVASAPTLDTPLGLTVEAWVYPTVSQNGWRAIVQRETDAFLFHASSSAGALQPTVGGIFSGQLDYFNAPTAIPVGAWTHLAFTWDGATMRLYVNGVSVASKARTGTLQTAASGAGPVRIGNNAPYLENFLGRIDDVRIYDVALTPTQIATDMVTPVVSGPDTTPPGAPSALGATAQSASQIALSWTAALDSGGSGLAGYRIERCQGAGCSSFAEIAQPTTSSFADSGLLASTLYRYRVRAIDGAGNLGGYSNTAEATTQAPPDTTPPTAPASLGATATSSTQIALTWTASTDAGGSGLSGYRVERCRGSGCSGFAEIAQPTTSSYADSGLLASTLYRYRVRAIDGAGNLGGYSNETEATTQPSSDTSPPTIPALPVVATASSTTQISLSWGASTDTGGSGLAGYRVERCRGPSCSVFVEIAQPTTAGILDSGLTASTLYRYRIRAVDGAGNLGGYSIIAEATTLGSSGLVAAYSFNEQVGLVTNDSSGNVNTGTITGATWNATGKFGGSLTFNGTGHVVLIPSSTSLNLSTGMTLEAWVYPTASQTGWSAIIQREADAYLLHAGSFLGALRPTAGGTFGTSLDYFAAPSAIPTNTWSHLALTWDGATMRLYVNGAQVASKARTGTLQGTSAGAGAVRIGNNVPYGERFIGRIDEVRIYNRGLSAAEVANDMNAPVP